MKDPLEKILKLGTFLSFTALILVVLFQVTTRFLFPDHSKVWTEEATRLFFVYAIAFAAPLAMKQGEYVNVDVITSMLPKLIRTILEIASIGITIFLFGRLTTEALGFAKIGLKQMSPTMKIPMTVAYSSIFIAITCIAIYAVVHLIVYIKDLMKRGEA